MDVRSSTARVDTMLNNVDELIVSNLDAYCLSEQDKKSQKYPEGLKHLEYLACEDKYDIGLFLGIPAELLPSAVSLLIFKKPLNMMSLANIIGFVAKRRLTYLLLVSYVPWKKARISGLYLQIGKSVAARNRTLNKLMRYLHSKIK